jgi:hypothetical protein
MREKDERQPCLVAHHAFQLSCTPKSGHATLSVAERLLDDEHGGNSVGLGSPASSLKKEGSSNTENHQNVIQQLEDAAQEQERLRRTLSLHFARNE